VPLIEYFAPAVLVGDPENSCANATEQTQSTELMRTVQQQNRARDRSMKTHRANWQELTSD